MDMTVLQLSGVTAAYNGRAVVNQVSLELKCGDIGCIIGPSGCGKTTLLRTIAGFEPLRKGHITIEGKTVASGAYGLAPEKRRIGMVFQDYALFPHLSVEQNVAFSLGELPAARRKAAVAELLERMALSSAAEVYPHELSGGQQQRVALARALAMDPALLLLDEPFSNLDVTLRERLSTDVRDILKARRISALMVTHNQTEAFSMGDVIGVMYRGELMQWDTAHTLYHRPANTMVAAFVGEGVLLPARVSGKERVSTELGVLEGPFSRPCACDCPVAVLIRPEDILLDSDSRVTARIVKKNFRGPNILYTLELHSSEKIMALVPSHQDHSLGSDIGIRPEVEEIVLFAQSEACS